MELYTNIEVWESPYMYLTVFLTKVHILDFDLGYPGFESRKRNDKTFFSKTDRWALGPAQRLVH